MRSVAATRTYFQITAIVCLAALMRLWGLGHADMVTDEALNSFRAVGMVDFLNTEFQTTPLEWFEEPQWWLRLSFHDHPPLSFLIQNIFFRMFGVGDLVARLPSACLGMGAVLLLYLLVLRWGNRRIALLAALILAVNNLHIWISRIALQESMLIFFMLLALIAMVCAFEKKKIGIGLVLYSDWECLPNIPFFISYRWCSSPPLLFHVSLLGQKNFGSRGVLQAFFSCP